MGYYWRKDIQKYQVRVRHLGVSHYGATFDREWEAQEASGRLKKALLSGRMPDASTPLFCHLVEQYLALKGQEAEEGTLSRRTFDSYTTIGRRIQDYFEGMSVNDLDNQAVENFKLRMRESVSGATVNRHLAVLSGIAKLGVARGFLEFNPVRQVERYREKPPTPDPLSVLEAKRLIDAAGESEETWLKPAVVVSVFTGIRLGELLGLTWRDVDLDRKTMKVSGKSGTRVVPLADQVVKTLLDYGATRDTTPTTPVFDVTKDAIHWWYHKALDRAGLSRVRWHDLRATCATWLATSQSAPVLQAFMGHKSITTTQRYMRLSAQDVERAVEGLPEIPV